MSDIGAFTPANLPKFTLLPSVEKAPTISATGKRIGRPPGAKNKPKDPDARNPSMDVSIPGSPRPKSTDPVDPELNKKAEKKQRADEYAKYISEEVNDKIFLAIVMLSGGKVKADAFYLPGKAPASKQSDPRLSELGNTVAIPPDMANAWGKLLAELSYTDAGKTATKYAGTSAVATLGAALTAIITTIQYAITIKPVVDSIKLLQEGYEVQEDE